jgi:hypothetical protein
MTSARDFCLTTDGKRIGDHSAAEILRLTKILIGVGITNAAAESDVETFEAFERAARAMARKPRDGDAIVAHDVSKQ